MKSYGITFANDGGTIRIDAELFKIDGGFVKLYRIVNGVLDCFAAYSATTVIYIVEQKT